MFVSFLCRAAHVALRTRSASLCHAFPFCAARVFDVCVCVCASAAALRPRRRHSPPLPHSAAASAPQLPASPATPRLWQPLSLLAVVSVAVGSALGVLSSAPPVPSFRFPTSVCACGPPPARQRAAVVSLPFQRASLGSSPHQCVSAALRAPAAPPCTAPASVSAAVSTVCALAASVKPTSASSRRGFLAPLSSMSPLTVNGEVVRRRGRAPMPSRAPWPPTRPCTSTL